MGKERLLASDYDGTLNLGGIGEAKKTALAEWKEKGNFFAVISGRGIPNLMELMDEDGIRPDFLVGDNGATIADGKGTVLCETGCRGDIAKELAEYLFALGCDWATLRASSFDYHVKPAGYPCAEWEIPIGELPQVPYFTQMSTSLRSLDDTVRIIGQVRERYGNLLNPLQNSGCIDIVSKNINKAVGIRRLIQRIGVNEADVIAVGDNVNDADMIRAFPSYAMENGVDELKRIAGRKVAGVDILIRELLGEQK